MNLVEGRLDGDAVEIGSHRFVLPPEHRPDTSGAVVVGVRPESLQDAAFADPSLPQLDAEVAVLEDLGSDVHVIFHGGRAARGHRGAAGARRGGGADRRRRRRLHGAGRRAHERPPGSPLRLALDPAGLLLVRSRDRREPPSRRRTGAGRP